jgi:hypothetical protein
MLVEIEISVRGVTSGILLVTEGTFTRPSPRERAMLLALGYTPAQIMGYWLHVTLHGDAG